MIVFNRREGIAMYDKVLVEKAIAKHTETYGSEHAGDAGALIIK